MAYIPNLALYYKVTCPYCLKVMAYMEQQDIEMEMRNVLEPGVLDGLVELTGRTQVPCLVIDGEPMLESDDIIAYLARLVEAEEIG